MATKSLSCASNSGAIGFAELFSIGIGPSSSHTVGPMRAAADFAGMAVATGKPVCNLQCELYGSLALTGKGHATDHAIILGLSGALPHLIDPDEIGGRLADVAATKRIKLSGEAEICFDPGTDIIFKYEFLPGHPNGMVFKAVLSDGEEITHTYFSIGGGAIQRQGETSSRHNFNLPLPFDSGDGLLALGDEHQLRIDQIMRLNEEMWRSDEKTDALIDDIRTAMMDSIARGIAIDGVLPGNLNVRRRAKQIHANLLGRGPRVEPASVLEWVSLWALAVNEENAAGGRVVTAPTNGAAGVIPSVLRYYETFVATATPQGSRTFLLTAAAIGVLYKKRASISAAEMGCQGEIGVACSMAAAGLAAALGGSNRQVENAAEIGMEHNLGLTCDPIGGLVQIPCIERNTMGAVKAINAATLALHGDGSHIVSLDAVIETMRQTGEDMRSKYKETSLGGLAVNVVEC